MGIKQTLILLFLLMVGTVLYIGMKIEQVINKIRNKE